MKDLIAIDIRFKHEVISAICWVFDLFCALPIFVFYLISMQIALSCTTQI